MIDKIVGGIITIAKVSVTLAEMLINLLKNMFLIFEMIPLIFNPVAIVNDAIIGVIMSIKVLVTSLFSFEMPFSTKSSNKCDSTGEGLFGYRRNRDENGKLTGQDKLDAKGSKKRLCKTYNIKININYSCIPQKGLFFFI